MIVGPMTKRGPNTDPTPPPMKNENLPPRGGSLSFHGTVCLAVLAFAGLTCAKPEPKP